MDNDMAETPQRGGTGNSYDYGARMYNSRLGRFFSLDPLAVKYPSLSPFIGMADNPILFIDYDGMDFGIKINHDDKTIVIVSNVYTISEDTFNEAKKAKENWESVQTDVDEYSISFKVNVVQVEKPSYISEKQWKDSDISRESEGWAKAHGDPIGNLYAGTESKKSNRVSGSRYIGGVTRNGKWISMNMHEREMGLGKNESFVTHEFGHLFGLDDEYLDDENKIRSPYYPGDGGIMEYRVNQFGNLQNINSNDVRTIINYARDYLSGSITDENEPSVIILEQKGKSDGNNPLGVTND